MEPQRKAVKRTFFHVELLMLLVVVAFALLLQLPWIHKLADFLTSLKAGLLSAL